MKSFFRIPWSIQFLLILLGVISLLVLCGTLYMLVYGDTINTLVHIITPELGQDFDFINWFKISVGIIIFLLLSGFIFFSTRSYKWLTWGWIFIYIPLIFLSLLAVFGVSMTLFEDGVMDIFSRNVSIFGFATPEFIPIFTFLTFACIILFGIRSVWKWLRSVRRGVENEIHPSRLTDSPAKGVIFGSIGGFYIILGIIFALSHPFSISTVSDDIFTASGVSLNPVRHANPETCIELQNILGKEGKPDGSLIFEVAQKDSDIGLGCPASKGTNLQKEFFPMDGQIEYTKALGEYALNLAQGGKSDKSLEVLSFLYRTISRSFSGTTNLISFSSTLGQYNVFHATVRQILDEGLYSNKNISQLLTLLQQNPIHTQSSILQAIRGEYYLAKHLSISHDLDLQKISLPFFFDGQEVVDMNKLTYANILMPTETEKILNSLSGKYIPNQIMDFIGDPSGVSDIKFTKSDPYNFYGRRLARSLIPLFGSYFSQSREVQVSYEELLHQLSQFGK